MTSAVTSSGAPNIGQAETLKKGQESQKRALVTVETKPPFRSASLLEDHIKQIFPKIFQGFSKTHWSNWVVGGSIFIDNWNRYDDALEGVTHPEEDEDKRNERLRKATEHKACLTRMVKGLLICSVFDRAILSLIHYANNQRAERLLADENDLRFSCSEQMIKLVKEDDKAENQVLFDESTPTRPRLKPLKVTCSDLTIIFYDRLVFKAIDEKLAAIDALVPDCLRETAAKIKDANAAASVSSRLYDPAAIVSDYIWDESMQSCYPGYKLARDFTDQSIPHLAQEFPTLHLFMQLCRDLEPQFQKAVGFSAWSKIRSGDLAAIDDMNPELGTVIMQHLMAPAPNTLNPVLCGDLVVPLIFKYAFKVYTRDEKQESETDLRFALMLADRSKYRKFMTTCEKTDKLLKSTTESMEKIWIQHFQKAFTETRIGR